MSGAPRIGLIDYGIGNRRSVQKALERAGAQVVLTGEQDQLDACDGLALPGVGAFPVAMRRLRELRLDRVIRAAVDRGVPLLGICLGMQLLFDRSEELARSDGLGLLRGQVRRLRTNGLRLPHIGWSEVAFERPCPLTDELSPAGRPFYHVHSFAVAPEDPDDVLGSAEYGERFASIVGRGQVFGVQFHPEKSSKDGLRMLAAFAGVCAAYAAARG